MNYTAKTTLPLFSLPLNQAGWERARQELIKAREYETVKLLDSITNRVQESLQIPRDEYIALQKLQLLADKPSLPPEKLRAQVNNIARGLKLSQLPQKVAHNWLSSQSHDPE